MELISSDPRVTHGQAVNAGTRVPASVILDCLACGITAEEITAEYPVTVVGVRGHRIQRCAGTRGPDSAATVAVTSKLGDRRPRLSPSDQRRPRCR